VRADTTPTDRAVLLLQRTRESLLDCRAAAAELGAPSPGQESEPASSERIAYGVLVAALEEGVRDDDAAPNGGAHTIQRAR